MIFLFYNIILLIAACLAVPYYVLKMARSQLVKGLRNPGAIFEVQFTTGETEIQAVIRSIGIQK